MKEAIKRYIDNLGKMTYQGGTAVGGMAGTVAGLLDIINEFPDTPPHLFNLDKFQATHIEWAVKNFGQQHEDEYFLGIVEEVGELSHAILKKKQGIRGDAAHHDAEARDAVGDILNYILGYCTMRGWKLSDVMNDTWDKVVSKRDWIKYPTNGVDK